MIEDEILNEINEGMEESCLFSKEEWEGLVKWSPVSNIPVEEIYKDLPKVKQYHDDYVNLWLKNKER